VGLFESEEESEKARQEVKHPDSVHNFESWHKIAHGGWEDETVMHEDSIEPQTRPSGHYTTYLPISNYQYYLHGPLNPLVLTYCHVVTPLSQLSP
jgi:hypothetical protein